MIESLTELSFCWDCHYCGMMVVEPVHNKCWWCGESPHPVEAKRIKRLIRHWEIENDRRAKDPACLVYKQQR